MTNVKIMVKHILHNSLSPIIVQMTLGVGGAILFAAALGFLGLGVQPPTPSWGAMIKEGTRYLLIAPHMALGPGLALFSIVIAVNALGDRLRDRLQIKRGAFQN